MGKNSQNLRNLQQKIGELESKLEREGNNVPVISSKNLSSPKKSEQEIISQPNLHFNLV